MCPRPKADASTHREITGFQCIVFIIFMRIVLEIARESSTATSDPSSNLNRQRGAQLFVYIGNKTEKKSPKNWRVKLTSKFRKRISGS